MIVWRLVQSSLSTEQRVGCAACGHCLHSLSREEGGREAISSGMGEEQECKSTSYGREQAVSCVVIYLHQIHTDTHSINAVPSFM